MLDIADELHRWVEQGRDFAVATVVAVGGSAPRRPGAALAVDADGTAIGSVSGGCVEGAVYELCQQALKGGESVLERFGYSDEDAFAVGLTCGGVIDILVTPVRAGDRDRPVVAAALEAAARGRATALARIVSGPDELLGRTLVVRPDSSYGGFGAHPELDRTVAAEAGAFLDAGRTGTLEIGEQGSRCGAPLTVLVESSVPPPRMIVFGAIDFASALVRIGKFLGHRVTVCDARPVFATEARFPEADEVVVEWPHRYLERTEVDARTVLCVLTHDAKFDVPLLQLALRLPVAYVGAMGSRRTHLDRNERLREVGVTERELARLHSPIGLDLGARTPEETALSIAAEIVAARRGGSGVSLTGAHTPIHHDETSAPARRIGSVA
ncbi:xanthine dehydrogenase accessory factor [Streptomyces sp. SAI-135]|uniref:XdhC family protein n=1 Tax=unclassified Streptomyces TaxID=2593676 RepID=UPI0024763E75|nr:MULTISPECIES: XdhC/CoxI family protein [unclassified Streptomyces]MDH6515628.1 xanthine dehydrogenase accessory factor [Streptomyces sp. SAI-090]MDH6588131.1 xanthine dehydrogenase accessory factor [Streptomyces sp. SAI-133]MDH6620285.1 xanthine dehydrogenase accessory factor [Streptomyces sp. SAI-135]